MAEHLQYRLEEDNDERTRLTITWPDAMRPIIKKAKSLDDRLLDLRLSHNGDYEDMGDFHYLAFNETRMGHEDRGATEENTAKALRFIYRLDQAAQMLKMSDPGLTVMPASGPETSRIVNINTVDIPKFNARSLKVLLPTTIPSAIRGEKNWESPSSAMHQTSESLNLGHSWLSPFTSVAVARVEATEGEGTRLHIYADQHSGIGMRTRAGVKPGRDVELTPYNLTQATQAYVCFVGAVAIARADKQA